MYRAAPKQRDNGHTIPHRPTVARIPQITTEDIQKLVFLNHESEVKTYRDVVSRSARMYRVTRVISPFLFFTEFDIQRPLGSHGNWSDAMQDFYNDNTKAQDYIIKTSTVFKFRCYAYLDSETSLWERVRVIRVGKEGESAEVYMCDMGQYRLVPIPSLMELNPDFCLWSAQGFRTHLIDIEPVGGGLIWSKEAVQHFQQLVRGKVFKTIVMTRSEEKMPDGFPETILHIGVTMIQTNPPANLTLQAQMVQAGMAEATGSSGGYPTMFGGGMGTFKLAEIMSAETSSLLCMTDADGPEVMDPKSFKEIEDAVADAKVEIQAVLSKRLEEEQRESHKIWHSTLYPLTAKPKRVETQLPVYFQERFGFIKFCHIVSPSCCFVQLHRRLGDIRDLELGISALVENQHHIPYTENRCGIPIACLLQEERDRPSVWVRAIVKQAVPNLKLLKVILVDYGKEISVKYLFTRYLPEYFQTIPTFAHRVHIEVEGMHPLGCKIWTTDTAESFRKYVNSWDSEVPLYYGWRPPKSALLRLQDWSQELEYERQTRRWIPRPPKLIPMNKGINELRGIPLLENLYISTGLDVNFEVLVPKGTTFQFLSLTDALATSGFANRTFARKTSTQVHEEIVKGMNWARNLKMQKDVSSGAIKLEVHDEELDFDLRPLTHHPLHSKRHMDLEDYNDFY